MIFGDDYDKSLWLMLLNDNINRDLIIGLVKSIPKELLLNLRNAVVEHNSYKLECMCDDIKEFHGEMYDSNGDLYSFKIDTKDDVLCLSRCVCKYGLYFFDCKIYLVPYDCCKLDMFKKRNIGKINYDYDFVKKENNVCLGESKCRSYDLVKTPFGDMLINYNNNLVDLGINMINDNRFLDDYNIEDMNDIYSFVKCKRKRKN